MTLPLTATMRSMWLHEQLDPGSVVNRLNTVVRFRGELDTELFEEAIDRIVDRHDVLRGVVRVADGEPRFEILHEVVVHVELVDVHGRPAADVEAVVEEIAFRPYDLERGPLFRFAVVSRDRDDHLIVIAMHHLVTDLWSLALLGAELEATYAALVDGGEPHVRPIRSTFADHVEAERRFLASAKGERQLEFWRSRLVGLGEPVSILPDHGVPGHVDHRGAVVTSSLDSTATAELRERASELRASPFSFVLAAFMATLNRYTGQSDLAVATIKAGRSATTAHVHGCFVNPVILRSRIDVDQTVIDAVDSVSDTVASAFANDRYPLQELIERLADERRSSTRPFARIGYLWQKTTRAFDGRVTSAAAAGRAGIRAALHDATIETVDVVSRPSPYELALIVSEVDDELVMSIEYMRELYDESTISRLLGHVHTVLRAMTVDPKRTLAELPLLTEAEIDALLAERTPRSLERGDVGGVHQLIERVADAHPDRVAIEVGATSTSYATLDERATDLGDELRRVGVRHGDLVAIHLERSVDMIAAALAVWKAGAAFVPLDPDDPLDRLRYMVADSGATVVVTSERLAGRLETARELLVDADDGASAVEADASEDDGTSAVEPDVSEDDGTSAVEADVSDDPPAVSSDDLAYAIYTSGSTGRPKAVAVEHGNLVNLLRSMSETPGLTAADVFLAHTTFSFDMAVPELFLPLITGARIVLVDHGIALDGRRVQSVIDEHGVTVLQATPSTCRLWIESGWRGGDRLSVWVGAEPVGAQIADELRSRVAEVWNAYGPTEATVWATFHDIGRSWEPALGPVPLGTAIPDVNLYVLDPSRRPVPAGVVGELCIGGLGVSRGYLGRPSLTADRFIPDPLDGCDRIYRTGDLVRRMNDGSMRFHGRIDDQVKLRGFRVELGEVEAAVESHPDVAAAVASVHHVAEDDARLVVHVTTHDGARAPTMPEVARHVRRTLPEHMVPAAVIELAEMPLTPNAKIDRTRVPPPTVSDLSPGSGEPPRPGLETEIADIWSEVLGVEVIGRDDDFFLLGGHSLLATRIASRLATRVRRRVDIRTVFENPTVAELAAAVESRDRWELHVHPVAVGSGGRRAGPLTHSQERMWFLHQMMPTSAAYNVAGGIRLRGRLDVDALGRAVDLVVRRHESLRTHFEVGPDGLVQVVDEAHDVELEVIDRSDLVPAERWPRIEEEMAFESRRSFDLAMLPLARFVLYRADDDDHGLLLVKHHIVSDQWSLGVLGLELAAAYTAFAAGDDPELPGLDLQLIDYGRWHRELVEEELGSQLDFWRAALEGLTTIELPADRPRPNEATGEGGTIQQSIPARIVAAVDEISASERLTPFMVLLAGFQALLARYTDESDIAVGTAIANRNWMPSEHLIGSLVNSVVIRTEVQPTETFRQLLGQVRATSLDAFENQDVPFARVVSELQPERDLSRSPLFQAFFNVLDVPVSAPTLPDIETELMHLDRRAAQFDVSLSISTADDQAVLEYSSDLFDRDRMERMLGHYWQLLDSLLTDPDRRIGEARMLTDAELAEHAGWSQRTQPVDDADVNVAAHRLIERCVAAAPDRPAVRDRDRAVTYRELNDEANRIARALIRRGLRRGQVVGLMVERSVELVTTVLGVLKAGCTFVPLDGRLPPDRLDFLIDDAGIATLIASTRDGVRASDVDLVVLEDLDLSGEDGSDLTEVVTGDDVAYIIYTSGSTGRPKGVVVPHRCLVHYLLSARVRPGMSSDDRVLAVTTLSFDPAIHELLLPLTVGAEILVVDRDVTGDAQRLRQVLEQEDVTIMQATPTTWRMLIEAGWTGSDDLVALCGGETMTWDLAAQLRERARVLFNLYGPTETTVWATAHEVVGSGPARSRWQVPIGTPIPGVELEVLDDFGEPRPLGVPGELHISGEGVSYGYLNRPELTAAAFLERSGHRTYRTGDLVVRHSDRSLSFVGRRDGQVKLRGHRIELGEIEAELVRHPDLAEVVAAVVTFGPGDERLVAYVRPEHGAPPITIDRVRSFLRSTLPAIMIPAAVVELSEFPRTRSNKVDRSGLPGPEASSLVSGDREPPQPGIERRIADIWEEVLGVSGLARDDDFFELGGHSLLAIRLFTRLEAEFSRSLPLAALFEAPTVAGLASLVDDDGWSPRWTSVVPVRPGGTGPPLFYVAPFLVTVLSVSQLGRFLPDEQPFYAIQPQGTEGDDPVDATLEGMAATYIEEMRRIQPSGPYLIGGHCSGSWVAFEIARQLQEAGEEVGALVLVDYGPPGVQTRPRRPVRHLFQRFRFYLRGGRLLDAIGWQLAVARERYIVRRIGRRGPRRVAEARRQHAVAHDRYRPRPIAGGALLVRSRESVELSDRSWHLTWDRWLSDDLEVEIVEGTHAGLVEHQYSEELAAVIADAITRRGFPGTERRNRTAGGVSST